MQNPHFVKIMAAPFAFFEPRGLSPWPAELARLFWKLECLGRRRASETTAMFLLQLWGWRSWLISWKWRAWLAMYTCTRYEGDSWTLYAAHRYRLPPAKPTNEKMSALAIRTVRRGCPCQAKIICTSTTYKFNVSDAYRLPKSATHGSWCTFFFRTELCYASTSFVECLYFLNKDTQQTKDIETRRRQGLLH